MKNKVLTPEEKLALRKKLKAKRKVIKLISLITFVVMLISAIVLFVEILSFGVLPKKYLYIIIGVLGVFILLFGAVALLPGTSNFNKKMQSVICLVLSVLLITGCVMLPVYKGKLEKMFVPVPNEGELNINIYTSKDKTAFAKIEDLAGKVVCIQQSMDLEYQEYAIKVINKEIQGADITTVAAVDIYEAVDKLYNNEVDAVMLNESYAEIIADNSDYEDFNDKTNLLYTCTQQITLEKLDASAVSNITKEPFIIAICGQDSYNYSSINKASGFRSDVNMVVVVNPTTKDILLISIPRDSYVGLYGNKSMMDKLTHSPMYKGMSGWVSTLDGFLDININYYVRVNFSSLEDIVNAITDEPTPKDNPTSGGLLVNNPYEFYTDYLVVKKIYDDEGNVDDVEYAKHTFLEGELHLNGAQALIYCRERKHLKNGDFGRNEHQAIVMKAMINQVCKVSTITKIGSLLDAVQGKFTTNISMNDIYSLAQMQLDDMADWHFYSYSITGSTGGAPSYMMGGKELSMVKPNAASVNNAKTYIQTMLKGGLLNPEDFD